MDGAIKAHQKILYRVLSYVRETAGRKLILKPNDNQRWELKGFSDLDFTGGANMRRSVSGYGIYLMGCPVAWKSKGQKNITLSSTEAEYVAILEISPEIIFEKDY